MAFVSARLRTPSESLTILRNTQSQVLPSVSPIGKISLNDDKKATAETAPLASLGIRLWPSATSRYVERVLETILEEHP